MNENKDMNINLFDLKFLIDRASSYVYNLKNERYSMKLWEDRIEEIRLKFNELIRGKGESYETYAYELGYVKDALINIYQKHPKVTFSKAFKLLTKEIGVPTESLLVKLDIENITYHMIQDGEISGEIDEINRIITFKGLRNEKS